MASTQLAPSHGVDLGAMPPLSANQADANGARTSKKLAAEVAEAHRKHLSSRRFHDLTREKYLLHIDGEGDSQWADILHGRRVGIPRFVTPYREQENLLRPIVANAVAYHTTMPLRFLALSKPDRESRNQARIDTLFANHVSRTQRLNSLSAQAMYMAMPTGFCPIHAYWREDTSIDAYEPLYLTDGELAEMYGLPPEQAHQARGMLPKPGLIDCWVGNPFDTTFNAGAKKDSIQAMWYGRVLPASLVRRHFDAELARLGVNLEGDTKLPSASVFQRIARKWHNVGNNVHGTSTMLGSEGTDEELIALVCREIAAGIDPDFPEGRLTLIALQGTSETREEGRRGHAGEPILLADQPLPAGRFSAELIYSDHGFDDVHGRPWVSDLDDLQVQLNITISKQKEYIERAINAPTLVSGGVLEDAFEYDAYTLLQLDGGQTSFPPQVMEIPGRPETMLEQRAERKRQAMFTLGGYQAASRGESHAGDAAAKVVALAQADDTIHGPINGEFRDRMTRYMGLCWSLMKTYGDVGWIVDMAGEDHAHLVDGYIDRAKLSDSPPTFRIVSGYGATAETQGQQLLNLVTQRGSDGQPLMSTAEFRRKWPDQTLYDDEDDPKAVQKRRAETIAEGIRQAAEAFREQTGLQEGGLTHPWVQQAGMQVFMEAEQKFPRLRDDDLNAHITALSAITQDETEDPIARLAAMQRQNLYFEWQAMMASQMPQQQEQPGQGGQTSRPQVAGANEGSGSGMAGNPAMQQNAVNQLTAQAKGVS